MKPSQSVRSRDCAASLELIAAPLVRAALLEDLGRGGDLTTEAMQDRATANNSQFRKG